MLKLGVNVDHVATLRQARGVTWPDPVELALAAERAGASAITAHLREDRRHIQDDDLFHIRAAIGIHLNQEMAPTAEMTAIALELHPHEVCLVPERREELTTEGGLDVVALKDRLAPIVERLRAMKINVSLFIDPDPHQVAASAELGVQFVELHTGKYANLADADRAPRLFSEPRASRRPTLGLRDHNGISLSEGARRELEKLHAAVKQARSLKLRPNVGHGLNYFNAAPVAAISGLVWAHIGHAIVARALSVGMERAVREMDKLINGAHAAHTAR